MTNGDRSAARPGEDGRDLGARLWDTAAEVARRLEAREDGSDARAAGVALRDALERQRATTLAAVVRIQARRVVSTAEDDQEWSETTASLSLTVTPDGVALAGDTNLATMVGASQWDRVWLATAGWTGATGPDDDASAPPDRRLERWIDRAERMLDDPDARYASTSSALAPVAPATPVIPGDRPGRVVVLRDERDGRDRRWLEARLSPEGDLTLEGQDLGPGTAPVSDDGEYEWITTVAAADLPALLALLGEPADRPVLDALATAWTGPASYDLEARLRAAPFTVTRWTW